MRALSPILLALSLAVSCTAQQAPIAGYFRDSDGALRALQGVEGAWIAPVVVPSGVISAGSSGKALWYKSERAIHVRATNGEWADHPAPEGPCQVRYQPSGEIAEFRFPATGEFARWDPESLTLGTLEYGQFDPEPEQIGAALFLERDGDSLLARRAGGASSLLPLADPVTFQLYFRDPSGAETPAGGAIVFPPSAAGDALELRFRIRNPGTASVDITRLSLDPGAFRLANQFFPPHIIAAGGFADFSIVFTQSEPGEYATVLHVNDLKVAVRASNTSLATVELEGSTGWQLLRAGEAANLGSVERRSVLKRRLRIAPAAAPVLSGANFALAATEDPAIFEVSFQSERAGESTATLAVGPRTFTLRATATEFPPLRLSIVAPATSPEPATQQKVTIQLSEAARENTLGTATLSFTPAGGLTDEPAIAFLPQLIRTVPLTFAAGSTQGEVTFQTGSTAGTITLRVSIGAQFDEVRFNLAARPIALTTTKAIASTSIPEVILTGYDNTRSVSKVAFTFYQKNGQTANPGRLEADVSAQFRDFFSKNAGGTFQLRATFPVSGTVSELESVDVEITSGQGVRQLGRLKLE